jgi:NTP pyrophosphatase (non-canonical NTP hydrolase)
MSDLETLTKRIVAFRNARDWKQFHNPKDMALSLVLEASELMEHFQWKNKEEMQAYLKTNKADVAEELSDVFYGVLLMAHDFDIDLKKVFEKKMKKNEAKYAVEKAKGKATKYNKL